MGDTFVTGQTIEAALARARIMEAKGFTYSYDMLGEAAMTADDAVNYAASYEAAIHAIGRSSNRGGIHEGPGISIKLSALHPRYSRAQRPRVMAELLPILKTLVILAKSYDIGINIDAEEADRLDLSLDLLEALCEDTQLKGWNGIGFVVQAYQKRAPYVIDFIIDLAQRTSHRLMIRLVKGAYWDSEIKRAQVDGLEDFPVFTRKPHTDISYLACAQKLLAARSTIFPQFATHNAQTLASIITMAGETFQPGDYEFQCLHGMGEGLYEHVVGPANLNRPCRIYAPVGGHETLLAYLVRRLLENGANSSFVNRLTDQAVSIAELTAAPTSLAGIGTLNPKIALPAALFPDRQNSTGLDLSSESMLANLASQLAASAEINWHAVPNSSLPLSREYSFVRNPANPDDIVGTVQNAEPADIDTALTIAAASIWPTIPAAERAKILRHAADLLQNAMPTLCGLIVREAGKTLPNAIGEVREAIDFLRYYATQVLQYPNATPLGPIACISPWNFPLAIFTGQIAAGLATGNIVLAKPAEETPLIAGQAVRILHQAGIPASALQLLPGGGAFGAALAADPRIQAVLFTGSLDTARKIQKSLALRLSKSQKPIPLIAETGGINVMIADSSALAEQLVSDVVASAFDSAGQRCSALRILCLQEEIYARTLTMLKGAMAALTIGDPAMLDTDIGPVITTEAQTKITAYIAAMRSKNFKITSAAAPLGQFIAPTIIEIEKITDVTAEIFGPVLHVMPYRAAELDQLIDAINATGYGLTFGLHTRIDNTITHVSNRISVGNIYINRNIIGAAVGVQPFGGHGLSGTGPKAGGPLLLRRLLNAPPITPTGLECAGPVGETNMLQLRPRGIIAALGPTPEALQAQIAIITQTGNTAITDDDWFVHPHLAAVLFDGAPEQMLHLNQRLANRPGPIIQILTTDTSGLYHPEHLMLEISISTNTAAAGGNASLLAIA
jgi:RHH-type proline utilization regulon transcriptional repressor/proline dehydrogenase/delta 1-pyrroline-5-carboxylate dehydrogenase